MEIVRQIFSTLLLGLVIYVLFRLVRVFIVYLDRKKHARYMDGVVKREEMERLDEERVQERLRAIRDRERNYE